VWCGLLSSPVFRGPNPIAIKRKSPKYTLDLFHLEGHGHTCGQAVQAKRNIIALLQGELDAQELEKPKEKH
jgi:hypothetical protein